MTRPVERVFEDLEGRRWTVEVGGRSRVGRRGERGVAVLLLLFRPEEADSGAPPLLEALSPGDELDDLPEARLRALLAGAEPFRPVEPREPPQGRRRATSRRDGPRRRDGGRGSGRRNG